MSDKLTFYRGRLNRQWRWRYQAEGNMQKLANGGEGYGKIEDCVRSAFRVLGLPDPSNRPIPPWNMPGESPNETITRDNGFHVEVHFPG